MLSCGRLGAFAHHGAVNAAGAYHARARQPLTRAPVRVQLAPYVQSGQQAEIAFGFDLWQLGMLIYEVHSGEPYWGRHGSDAAIFETLLDSGAALPHESRPIKPPVMQSVVARLLTRRAEVRLTAQQLEDVLATEVTSEMPNLTINRGERMVVEPARVLAI